MRLVNFENKELLFSSFSIPMAPSHDFDCGLETDKGDIVGEVRGHPFDALKNIKIANFGKE